MKVLSDAGTGQIAAQTAPPRPVLPENEVIRRAEFTMQTGQTNAALRVLNYCLRHYPESSGARILRSEILEREGQLDEAHEYLVQALALASGEEGRLAIEVNLIHLNLKLNRYQTVQEMATELLHKKLDVLGKLHVELYSTAAHAWSTSLTIPEPRKGKCDFVSIVIHCEDDVHYAKMVENLSGVMEKGNFEIIRTQGESRIAEYEQAMAQAKSHILLFIRPEVEILAPDFHRELTEVMSRYDVAGYAGADRLAGARWFDAGFPHAHGAAIFPTSGQRNRYDLSIYGSSHQRFHDGLAVLDGALLAAKKHVLDEIAFDRELDGEHTLCELDWCRRASAAGYTLAAAPLFGVFRHQVSEHIGRNWHDCANYFQEKHGLPDTTHSAPVAGASVQMNAPELALPILNAFYLNNHF